MRRRLNRVFPALVVAVAIRATAVEAQHASDNPVTAAQDAYGLTLGLESVGIYSPGLIRGFSPQAAGNVRVDGVYFDEQGGLSNRVIDGSTIRVGITAIGYPFPAPTGIVDYNLRSVGDGTPSGTIIANVGPYEAWGVSIDGIVPLEGNELVLPIGVSTGVSTGAQFGNFPGVTSHVSSAGATPQWKPNSKITVRGLIDWQDTRVAKTLPLYFTAGDFEPPTIPHHRFLGQDWAKGSNTTLNLGGIVTAQLADDWSLKAGAFRSTNDSPSGYADLFTDIARNGQSDHLVIGYPDQRTSSNSGEVRLTGTFTSGDWRQQIIANVRGRDTIARYGGEDAVDLGPAVIGSGDQLPPPDFVYSALSTDHTKLWSAGVAYHLDWKSRGEFETGIQMENYDAVVTDPGKPVSEASAHPLRVYGNGAFALTSDLSLYADYTQGLEDSGVAPNSATNSGAVLPASLTWQVDTGLRYAVTPDLKIIGGVFQLQKPYFNFDTNNVDRELGEQTAKGLELSVAGEIFPHFTVNIGVLDDRVGITGPDLAAEGVGSVAVGQPHLMYVANANYDLPWWPQASLDFSATHFGRAPESVDNGVYTPATTMINIGGRYKFSAFGTHNSLRLEIQNVTNYKLWTNAYTPGFFEWPGPHTVFAYLTTDLQG